MVIGKKYVFPLPPISQDMAYFSNNVTNSDNLYRYMLKQKTVLYFVKMEKKAEI